MFGDDEPMTQNKNEKRAAREFSRKHDVSYTEALRIVRQAKERSEATGEPIIVAKQGKGTVKD